MIISFLLFIAHIINTNHMHACEKLFSASLFMFDFNKQSPCSYYLTFEAELLKDGASIFIL